MSYSAHNQNETRLLSSRNMESRVGLLRRFGTMWPKQPMGTGLGNLHVQTTRNHRPCELDRRELGRDFSFGIWKYENRDPPLGEIEMIFSSPVVNLRLLNGGRIWLSSSCVTFNRLSNSSLVPTEARISYPLARRAQQFSQLHGTYPIRSTGQTSSHSFTYSTGRPGENQGKQGKKRSKMWMTSLLVGLGLGGLVGFGYVWREKNKKIMPIANIDTGNDLLYSQPPPVDVIAKEVKSCDSSSWC